MTDHELAASLADAAGRLLLKLRESTPETGAELGALGDRSANALLLEAIRQHRPEDGLLSEEESDSPDRLAHRRVWVIDPLDGTREYSEGRSDWAVHVALSIDGVPAVGAVALPALGIVLRSDQPSAPPVSPGPLRMVVSRTRPAAEAVAVARALGAELLPMGSAGAKAMAVVRGEAEIYLHTGGQYAWDNCAPAAVALGYGFHASRIDGTPLRYDQSDTYVPDLLICSPALAEPVLQALAALKAGSPLS